MSVAPVATSALGVLGGVGLLGGQGSGKAGGIGRMLGGVCGGKCSVSPGAGTKGVELRGCGCAVLVEEVVRAAVCWGPLWFRG